MSQITLRAVALCLVVCACQQPAPPAMAPVEKKVEPAPAAPPSTEAKYLFGVAMPFGSTVGIADAQATSSYLSKVLGVTVEARLFDYDDLADAIADGKLDFAFMPPLAYVKASKKSKVQLLRQAMHGGSMSYRSVLFVRKDSPIKKTDELRGTKMAWVSGGSTSGRLVPLAWFASRKIDPAEFFATQTSYPNHGKVCKAVFNRDADVGASFSNPKDEGWGTVDGCKSSLNDFVSDLRIIYASAAIPNDVVVLRADAPADLTKKLGDAFDHIGQTDEGKDVLRTGFQAEGFYPVTDAVFDPVRDLLSHVAPPEPAAVIAPATP